MHVTAEPKQGRPSDDVTTPELRESFPRLYGARFKGQPQPGNILELSFMGIKNKTFTYKYKVKLKVLLNHQNSQKLYLKKTSKKKDR